MRLGWHCIKINVHFRLSKNKQSRLYLPEYPFPHADVSSLLFQTILLITVIIVFWDVVFKKNGKKAYRLVKDFVCVW